MPIEYTLAPAPILNVVVGQRYTLADFISVVAINPPANTFPPDDSENQTNLLWSYGWFTQFINPLASGDTTYGLGTTNDFFTLSGNYIPFRQHDATSPYDTRIYTFTLNGSPPSAIGVSSQTLADIGITFNRLPTHPFSVAEFFTGGSPQYSDSGNWLIYDDYDHVTTYAPPSTVVTHDPIQLSPFQLNLSSYQIPGSGSVDMPPPTLGELAQIATAVYGTSGASVGAYQVIDSLNGSDGLFIEVLQNGNQIVFAIRGTNPENTYDAIDNLLADTSWISGKPNGILGASNVAEAALFLNQTVAAHQGSNITITGHSLGGAIAQLLGDASGYTTVGFNAPGAKEFEAALSAQLAPAMISGLGQTRHSNSNYRVAGDQVSLVGTEIGTTYTISNPNTQNWGSALNNHSMSTVGVLISNSPAFPGRRDQPFTGFHTAKYAFNSLLNFLYPIGLPGQLSWLDPAGASDYAVVVRPGSPLISSIVLPDVGKGVDHYVVRTEVNGIWSAAFSASPTNVIALAVPAEGVDWQPVQVDGTSAPISDSMVFGLAFATAGTFNGVLATATDVSAGAAAITGSQQPFVGSPPVFRFFSQTDGTHFFTADAAERDSILATRPDLIYEGVGLNAVDTNVPGSNAAPVYRFFSVNDGTHFFTSSLDERNNVINTRPDLVYEGIGFSERTVAQVDDVAVYRFFDSNHGTHFYTSNAAERDNILSTRPDLVSEGIGFYVPG